MKHLFLLCLLLAGCGGGSFGDSPSPQKPYDEWYPVVDGVLVADSSAGPKLRTWFNVDSTADLVGCTLDTYYFPRPDAGGHDETRWAGHPRANFHGSWGRAQGDSVVLSLAHLMDLPDSVWTGAVGYAVVKVDSVPGLYLARCRTRVIVSEPIGAPDTLDNSYLLGRVRPGLWP